MDILFLLIPLSVVLVLIIGVVFWYALRSGQFDDLDLPGLEVIADHDLPDSAKVDAMHMNSGRPGHELPAGTAAARTPDCSPGAPG